MQLFRKPGGSSKSERMPLLKRLFWVYFLLLIFEGALRKWIAPQYSAPLLLIRDPISVLIIWQAYRTNKWPAKWTAVTAALAVGLVGLCVVQMVVVDNPWFAAAYGLRSYLLPFPVVFIMSENLDAEDLRKFGRWTLWLLLLLTALELLQYISPPNSFWNAAASEGATQLGYAEGHVRASGTFSYVMGPMFFTPMAGAFIFYGLVEPKFVKKWLLWTAAAALILSIPLIGSRVVIYEMAALLGCVAMAGLFGVSRLLGSIRMIVAMLFVFVLVSQLPVFSEASDTFVKRFTDATNGEGGSAEASLYKRVVDPFSEAIENNLSDTNLLGIGIGRGANAISRLVAGQILYSAGEETVKRTLNECGLIVGVAFLLFRYGLAIYIAIASFARARERPLALLLLTLTIHALTLGGLDQPTSQGFVVMGTGFSLAILKSEGRKIERH